MSTTATTAIGTALVVLAMLGSGVPKAIGQKSAIARVVALNFSAAAGRMIGCVEVVGAIGLVAGLAWPVIGLLAGTGCAALMAGAAVSHLRARDSVVRVLPAAVVGLIAAAVSVLHYVAL